MLTSSAAGMHFVASSCTTGSDQTHIRYRTPFPAVHAIGWPFIAQRSTGLSFACASITASQKLACQGTFRQADSRAVGTTDEKSLSNESSLSSWAKLPG